MKISRILLPLDGSALAESVLPHAVVLSKVFGAKIYIIKVLEPTKTGELRDPVDPLNWRINRVEAETYVNEIAARFEQVTGNDTHTELLEGVPAQRIVEYADQHDIDLIILSSHGQSGITRWNVSSVTRKITQNAHRSIMIVRAYAEKKANLEGFEYQNILTPLDGSRRSECLLPVAETLARYNDANLMLAHIILRPQIPRRSPPTREDTDLIDRFIERNRQEVIKYFEHIQSTLSVNVETLLSVDNSVEAALHDLAHTRQADLVIMAAHGFSTNQRQPFGNVTTNFVEYGDTALLIIQDLPSEEFEPTRAELAAQEQKGH
jgi:nucleotide-binding universal stress UspA family protein